MTELQKMGAAAKEAAAVLRTAGEKKRRALLEAAQALRAAGDTFSANADPSLRTRSTLRPRAKAACATRCSTASC